MHPPTSALNGKRCRNWPQDIEDQATWLAEELLISEESALYLEWKELTTAKAATMYEISSDYK
jgi:hypothetical protein